MSFHEFATVTLSMTFKVKIANLDFVATGDIRVSQPHLVQEVDHGVPEGIKYENLTPCLKVSPRSTSDSYLAKQSEKRKSRLL